VAVFRVQFPITNNYILLVDCFRIKGIFIVIAIDTIWLLLEDFYFCVCSKVSEDFRDENHYFCCVK